jgi:hypothetical protein
MEMGSDMLFLLGGHDLEMITIREILEEKSIPYVDKNLRWDNACLSRYSEELNLHSDGGMEIYGVELREDIPAPANYRSIDHHNDKFVFLSSLEQVAEILNYELNQNQRLVAANDKGYIPEMIKAGATTEQIREIRKKDRLAQGGSDDEEALAEASIRDDMECIGRLTKVKSRTKHFSIIADLLYPCDSLLIYTSSEWVYYGYGRDVLRTLFHEDIVAGRIYYGGKNNGYIGLVDGALPENEMNNMVDKIIKELRYV